MKLEKNSNSMLFSSTEIPDVFFTEYMSQANGDFIKVYLCLLFLSKYDKDINVGQGEPKVLDIEIKYDKDIYQFEHIVGGIEDFTDFGSWEPLSGLVEVPSGINALMCIWRKFNEDLSEDYFVVAKDISYLKNNSKLVFDVADCVHKVSYYPLGPDGKLIDKITTYDEYLASDEMAKKRHVFQVNEEDAADN